MMELLLLLELNASCCCCKLCCCCLWVSAGKLGTEYTDGFLVVEALEVLLDVEMVDEAPCCCCLTNTDESFLDTWEGLLPLLNLLLALGNWLSGSLN